MRDCAVVAIYLDTNAMFNWFSFAEDDRIALAVLANEMGQDIVVPSLVAEELEGQVTRRLTDAADRFDMAAETVVRLFGLEAVETEPGIDIVTAVRGWRRRLDDTFLSCEVSPVDALDGLRREISGTPPASRDDRDHSGRSGRDAAIWLAIVRDHLERDEPGFFISRDKGFWAREAPKARILGDLDERGQPLQLRKTIQEFLLELGVRHRVELTASDLPPTAIGVISEGLVSFAAIPQAVFPADADRLEARTVVSAGTPGRVHRASRFTGADGDIMLIDACWELMFRLRYRDKNDATADTFETEDLSAEGRVQMYLGPTHQDQQRGQFIDAQLKPRETLWVGKDGRLVTIRTTVD